MDNFINCNENILPLEESSITILKNNRGRKTNLYICEWNISNDDKKTHLKNLKKSLGCNGSIKKIKEYEDDVLHLQGDHSDKVKEYLINNGIEESTIIIKL